MNTNSYDECTKPTSKQWKIKKIESITTHGFFHWVTVFLVGLAYLSIELRGDLESARRAVWTNVHLWGGVILIVFTLIRILWKNWVGNDINKHRSPISFFSRLSNGLLLIFLIAQPILGVLTMNASGHTNFLSGTEIKISLLGKNTELADFLHATHQWVGNAFYWVIAIHALIGIWQLSKNRNSRASITID
jgi:cytochrome b561